MKVKNYLITGGLILFGLIFSLGFIKYGFSEITGNSINLNDYLKFFGLNLGEGNDEGKPITPPLPLPGDDKFNVMAGSHGENKTHKVMAITNQNPPIITLKWLDDVSSYDITIQRRNPGSDEFNTIAIVNPGIKQYNDTNVSIGETYEYYIYDFSGRVDYILAGINITIEHFRGNVLVIYENSIYNNLSSELLRFQKDLIGDGWKTKMIGVNINDNVTYIKSLIVSEYINNKNLSTIILIGEVPVPYAGEIYPDGHTDHYGAWPADVYYGELNMNWTDNYLSINGSTRRENWNLIGDGKFDNYYLQTEVNLTVGRIDLSNMTSFSKNNLQLLKQYLDKDYNYKHAITKVPKRVLISDNFKSYSEGFSQSGWRLTSLVGTNNVSEIPWNNLTNSEYLWGYGCGGGSYTSASGIGTTAGYASTSYKAVFNLIFGSYFGDWDSTNNFLRAPLANNGLGLTNAWAGRPLMIFHHMGIGKPIGYSFRHNYCTHFYNIYSLYTYGECEVHIALMGDPTLRLEYNPPVSNIVGLRINDTSLQLNWSYNENNYVGFYLYRAINLTGDFILLNENIITEKYYMDNNSTENFTYMIRAVYLSESGSGTYYNPTIGEFFSLSDQDSLIVLSPENNTFVNSGIKNLNCNIYDNSGINNITIFIWNSTGLIYSNFSNLSGTYNSSSVNYNFNREGRYYWNCLVGTNNGLITNIINYTINVDITKPIVFVITPSDNFTIVSGGIEFIFNVSDNTVIKFCNLSINNNQISNTSEVINGTNIITTTLSQGNYLWNITCYDIVNNFNNSNNYNLMVNAPPSNEPTSPPSYGSSSGSSGGGSPIKIIPKTNLTINESEKNNSIVSDEKENNLKNLDDEINPEENISQINESEKDVERPNVLSKIFTNINLLIGLIIICLIILIVIILVQKSKSIVINDSSEMTEVHKYFIKN